jgi:hypothetical protein
VTVGLTTPKLVELTEGVKAGDAVIVKGQQELPDGADIAPEGAKADDDKKDDKKDDKGEKEK